MPGASTGVPAGQRCQVWAGGPAHHGGAGCGVAQRATPQRAGPGPLLGKGWWAMSEREGFPQVICPSPPTLTTGGAPLSSQPHTPLLPESCFLHPSRGNAWCCPLALSTPHEQEATLIPRGWEAHATSVLREADCARPPCVTRGRR